MDFRKLTADEIECRVAQINQKGCTLLLYKNARADMNLLDETVGAENWQRSHEVINGNLFCNVAIKIEGEWVTKQDVGTESNTEAEKGQASDSFKRACVNWGIGRELYTSPFIWIAADKYKSIESNGKYKTYDRFVVTKIGYSKAGAITDLVIKNATSGSDVFIFEKGKEVKTYSAPDVAEVKMECLKLLKGKSKAYIENVCKHYEVKSVSQLTPEQCEELLTKLTD